VSTPESKPRSSIQHAQPSPEADRLSSREGRRLPVAGPWITATEVNLVAEAAAEAWYSNANYYNDKFEREFAKHTGRRYAISLPSCTSAIHLALCALGVGPGDDVIVPDATWIASAAPVTYCGAKPVFVDIDEDSWCIRPSSLEAAIGPATKAVIAVDLYGNLPDYDAVTTIAKKHDVAVIEDAAEAIGADYKGKKAGGHGVASTFSFHGSKTLTTGEGGMLVTDDDHVYQRSLQLRDHGRRPGDKNFWNVEVGYKYKMSSLQAALGLAQLSRVDELIQRKRDIFRWYEQELEGETRLRLNPKPPHVNGTFWMVTALLDEGLASRKDEITAALSDEGIDTRPFFHPLSSLPAYAGQVDTPEMPNRNKVAYSVASRAFNLPSGLLLAKADVGYVCETLRSLLGGAR
jgi:perosamine synthetase